MRYLALLLAASALAATNATAVAGSGSSAPETARSAGWGCQVIYLGGRGYVFYREGLTCRRAKRLARYVYRTHRRPDRRWRCSSGSNFTTGAYCRRPGALFGWHPGD